MGRGTLVAMTRVAVIGGGRIGEALVAGLLESGWPLKDLVVAERVEARATEVAERFGVRVSSPADAVEGAHVVVLAVKPTDVDAVLSIIGRIEVNTEEDQLVISLAAGVGTARIEGQLPAGAPVVRAMPNTPMLVGEGMSVIAAGRHASAADIALARTILESVGRVLVLPETSIDAVTAVSGSGPAYFWLVTEAIIDGAVGLGLDRATASTLVTQTLVGAAALLDRSDQTPAELRAAVTSPAGTTAAAIGELERAGLRAGLLNALDAAKRRSVELGRPTEESPQSARASL